MKNLFMIRKFQASDKDECRALWRELTEWHRQIYRDPTIGGEHPEDYFDKHLAKVGSHNLWVAVSCSQVVGLIGLIYEENEAEIEPLIVNSAYRQKGIGKQLLNTVIHQARRKGVKYLNIKPVARNTKAVKFLHEQGFKNLGCIELFIDFSGQTWEQGPKVFGCKFNF